MVFLPVTNETHHPPSLRVTNAFRPFVVLLRPGRLRGLPDALRVTNAFRPFVVLLQKLGLDDAAITSRVTNAFRPFVVLLRPRRSSYCRSDCSVTNAFRPFVVLLQRNFISRPLRLQASHQCLSAFCGVVTDGGGEMSAPINESPMPFGFLWCCYPLLPGVGWIGDSVTNAFRLFVVLLLPCALFILLISFVSHQCLSAFCGVVTKCFLSSPFNFRQSHQCLSAFCGVVTVPRYFQWERGGLDAHGMMTGDDTGGDVWTVAGAW